jgi:hypothetical protein
MVVILHSHHHPCPSHTLLHRHLNKDTQPRRPRMIPWRLSEDFSQRTF